MSRDSFKSQPMTESYYVNGAIARLQEYDYSYQSVSRSELVKTTKDLAGWRGPTPYQCTVLESYPLSGQVDYETTYFGNSRPPLSEVYEGSLGNLFYRVMPGPNILFNTGLPGANDKYRAEVECLLKVRDMSVNLLQVFAERQKTVDLILDRSTRLFRAYKLAKRGKFRDAAKMLGVDKGGKKTASSWLELQYGWLPLMSDIYGGYKAITGRRAVKGMLFNVTRTISSNDSRTIDSSASSYSAFSNIQTHLQTKVSLWYTVEYESLLEASRVGLFNPLEIAWEITPWSFVVDWFLPIGNVLGALSATSGCTFKGGTCTQSVRGTLDCTVTPFGRTDYNRFIEAIGNAKGSYKVFKMDRSVYYGSPIPVPYVKNPLSVGHALNAVALIRSLF